MEQNEDLLINNFYLRHKSIMQHAPKKLFTSITMLRNYLKIHQFTSAEVDKSIQHLTVLRQEIYNAEVKAAKLEEEKQKKVEKILTEMNEAGISPRDLVARLQESKKK
ncbi:H-NS family histone-like protein [Vibrio sp. Hal054]|uniref:H-NS family histone-like protein n=1 Tax=Vibrio sp. Hal054 TaxID=3035158 RepID=UPI00301D139D